MKRKSLRILIQVLLLGLLLGTSSSAYADAISITSVSVTNLQLVPTSGTIVFFTSQLSPQTIAHAVVTDGFDGPASQQESPTRSEASISLPFANAAAVSDLTNLSFTANSDVMLSGCLCSFESEGQAVLRQSFMIVGGSGNVAVNISALLVTVQTLLTDQFSFFAASDARIILQVVDVNTFSVDSRLRIGPSDSTTIQMQRQLSEILTLQFDKEYNLVVLAIANSRAGQNEIPEPASVVLLVSGLGFMAGLVKKWRPGH